MTYQQALRLVRAVALAERRAKRADDWRLKQALNDAGYYAGLALGEMLAKERANGESTEQKQSASLLK